VSEAGSQPTVAVGKDLRGVLPAGARLRGYEILAVLGHGGFGVTYQARDTTLGRDVAIKEYLPTAVAVREDGTTVLPRSTALADEFRWGRDRFLQEARTLAKLGGAPAIVRVFDFLEANGTAYMVMALLDGESLEQRLRREGCLSQPAIERLLDPLLDGLAAVHAAGFLHRDIKPANIMLDAKSSPTLIDFGASRAPMPGQTAAMTAIFTPGYAAAEQFTSAKQGPWTDIYGLCATLYHTIVGRPPPSAFDRMVNDTYEPLAKLRPAGFSPVFLATIDAGLKLRATDRPQSITEWRPMFGRPSTPDRLSAAVSAAPSRGLGLWMGLAAAVILALAGGGYYFVATQPASSAAAGSSVASAEKVAQDKAADQRQQEQAELARLRAEAAAREKAEEEALKRQVEDEIRRKIEGETAEKNRLEEEAKQKADAEAAAKRKADTEAAAKRKADAEAAAKRKEEVERNPAEAAEAALQLGKIDRQHIQVALVALRFGGSLLDGTLGPSAREMIAAWQKARNQPVTGFLTGPQNQALLQEAAAAVTKFDDEQKKIEEEKKKAATGTASVNPDIVPLENNKGIVLYLAPGQNCNATAYYVARVFANRLDLQFRGGWQTFAADKAGDFARRFPSPVNGTPLSVKGNLKTRLVSVENVGSRCVWRGSF
jgi:serine/threonine protein kinase